MGSALVIMLAADWLYTTFSNLPGWVAVVVMGIETTEPSVGTMVLAYKLAHMK